MKSLEVFKNRWEKHYSEIIYAYLILPVEEVGKEEIISGGPLEPGDVVLRASSSSSYSSDHWNIFDSFPVLFLFGLWDLTLLVHSNLIAVY